MGGHPQVQTPNLERFARTGMVFTNAQSNAGWCAPSRASLLTGIAPWHSGLAMKKPSDNPVLRHCLSLPQYFKQNGYFAVGTGKTEHGVVHQGTGVATTMAPSMVHFGK